MSAVLAGCSSNRGGSAGIEEHIAENLARVLGVKVERVACPAGDVQAGMVCTVSLRGQEPFDVDVAGRDDQGKPRWKPRGKRKFEYQIAEGLAREVRQRPDAVICPDDGDVAAGFECQVTLPGDVRTTARVTAATKPEHFDWHAHGVLMLGVIEARVAEDLAQAGNPARIDCGTDIRLSTPEVSFPCAVRYTNDKASASIKVTVVDAGGHVRYSLEPTP